VLRRLHLEQRFQTFSAEVAWLKEKGVFTIHFKDRRVPL
jgi:hypothetical protein